MGETWKEQRAREKQRMRQRGHKGRVKESASGHPPLSPGSHLLCMTALLSELANVPCHGGARQ